MAALTPREVRTVRAALAAWLNEVTWHSAEELQAAYAALGADPLTPDEVAALMVRLADETDELAFVSEIANAAQVLAGRATALRHSLGTASDSAIEIEAATDRVVRAVRQLQPKAE